MSARIPLLLLVTTLMILTSGCAATLDFNSPSALGVGVRGKYWRTPYAVDAGLYIPGAQAVPALLNSFDAAVSGSSIQLTATWHDANQTFYKGYAALYQDGTGWAPIGSNFGPVASDSTRDLGEVTLASAPGGLFVANFFSASAGVATTGASSAYSGSSWQTYTPAAALGVVPDWQSTYDYISGPRTVSTIDSLGRAFVFFTDSNNSVPNRVRGIVWQAASTNGLDATTLQDVSGAAVSSTGVTTGNSGLTARFDGVKQVCVTYELSAGPALTAKCADITATGVFTAAFSGATASSISTAAMAGHETATDGAGNVMAVFYQLSGSNYQVYASLGANGVWPATPTQIDGAMDSGYVAPSPTTIAGARPGVASIGGGKFIATWVGVSASSTPKATQLYSSVYTPGTGWSAAVSIAGTYDPFLAIPHAQGLHVFGNGNGNAGFALSKIYTTNAIPPAAAISPDYYTESKRIRLTQVARWQKDNGWLPAITMGNYCYNNGAGTVYPGNIGTADGYCNRRPTGVMLPSGNTLVFFQDRDDYTNSTSPGNRRLSVVEFR